MSLQLAQEYKALIVTPPKAITADELSSAVSVEAYENDALAIVTLGAITGSDTAITITVKGSDASGGTYATIGTFTAVATTDDNKIAAIPVSIGGSSAKFIKFNFDISGTDTPTANVAAVLMVRPTVAADGINSATFAA